MMVAASCLDLVRLIRMSVHCSCFPPAQAPSLPLDLFPWAISLCPVGKAACELPVTTEWKVLGGKHMGSGKVLLFGTSFGSSRLAHCCSWALSCWIILVCSNKFRLGQWHRGKFRGEIQVATRTQQSVFQTL